MQRARRTTARERQEVLRSQARSGLSLAEYARREGLDARLLYNWRHRESVGVGSRSPRKRARRSSTEPGSLIPVEVVVPEVSACGDGRVTVEFSSGETLHVPAELAAEQLEAIVRAVRRCC